MKRTKSGTSAFYIVVILLAVMVADGCKMFKKDCGCGMDLNGTYKARHHWYGR